MSMSSLPELEHVRDVRIIHTQRIAEEEDDDPMHAARIT